MNFTVTAIDEEMTWRSSGGLAGNEKILSVLKLHYINLKVCPFLSTDFQLSHLKVGTVERVQKGKLTLRETWKLPFHMCSCKRTHK